MKKILLLDIENIQKNEQELIQLLTQYQQIYLVYAKSPISISLDHLLTFASFIEKKRLVLIKMPKIGKDAADFGLAFLAGQLSIQLNAKEEAIDIMSNDKALEYIVDLLQMMQFQVTLIKKTTIDNESNHDIENKLKTALQILRKNQPKTINALQNALKSWLKFSAQDVQNIIAFMKQNNLIRVQDNIVTYLCLLNQIESTSEHHLTVPSIQEIAQKPNLQHIKSYCDYLYRINARHRPTKEQSLINSVKSILKFEHVQMAINTVNALKNRHIVQTKNGGFHYNQSVIQQWATLTHETQSQTE